MESELFLALGIPLIKSGLALFVFTIQWHWDHFLQGVNSICLDLHGVICRIRTQRPITVYGERSEANQQPDSFFELVV